MSQTGNRDTTPRDGHPVLTLRLAPAVREQLTRAAREQHVAVSALVRAGVFSVIAPTLTTGGSPPGHGATPE